MGMRDITKSRAYNADWESIKSEFLKGMSYRALAEKYNVGLGTISEHAKKGDWARLRERVAERTEQKVIENISDRNARINTKIVDAVEVAIDKIHAGLKVVDKKDSSKIRAYMSALKDAKDMGIYRSDMDKAEQTARIKKLEAEVASADTDTTIQVVLSDEVREYAD